MMDAITTVDELRAIAKKRVPTMFYDYMESGSWTETTFRANCDDFQKISFRQRVAVDMSNRTTKTKMIGEQVAMPCAIAPTGLTGMQHADGEILAARAAAKFGIPFTLSTLSICSIEDVATHSPDPFWFQLYVMKDHDYAKRLIDRAKAAGCSALMLTLDLQILGQRHKDIKNGLSTPPKLTVKNILDMAMRPRWCMGMLGTSRRSFGNIVGHVKGISDTTSLSAWTAEQFDPKLDWNDVKEIREMWDGKVILKGILDEEDAKLGLNVGADAIIVSNHGGRQLDGAQSAIRMLPKILDAVGDKIEVHMDSGIRSGQDVLKALALGAKGTYIGRSFVYGLGAMGQQGVNKALEIIQKELETSMALCGCRTIEELSRDILRADRDGQCSPARRCPAAFGPTRAAARSPRPSRPPGRSRGRASRGGCRTSGRSRAVWPRSGSWGVHASP